LNVQVVVIFDVRFFLQISTQSKCNED
jgi:hypothetical protein